MQRHNTPTTRSVNKYLLLNRWHGLSWEIVGSPLQGKLFQSYPLYSHSSVSVDISAYIATRVPLSSSMLYWLYLDLPSNTNLNSGNWVIMNTKKSLAEHTCMLTVGKCRSTFITSKLHFPKHFAIFGYLICIVYLINLKKNYITHMHIHYTICHC